MEAHYELQASAVMFDLQEFSQEWAYMVAVFVTDENRNPVTELDLSNFAAFDVAFRTPLTISTCLNVGKDEPPNFMHGVYRLFIHIGDLPRYATVIALRVHTISAVEIFDDVGRRIHKTVEGMTTVTVHSETFRGLGHE